MLAENEIDSPELKLTPIDDPGYHYPREVVDRYFLFLERWGIPPDVLDRQDRRIIEDIELRSAMKSQAQREYWKMKEPSEDDGSF